MGEHSYVEIEALTRLANGSLSYRGNQIVLTLPPSNANTTTAAQGFTREFFRASIEQISVIREWRSTLIAAVQRGLPITDDWMTSFRDRAQHNLRLVSLAASSESDKNAFQLLTNEFNNMKQLSDRFVDANKSRTYTPTNAVENDPLDRRMLEVRARPRCNGCERPVRGRRLVPLIVWKTTRIEPFLPLSHAKRWFDRRQRSSASPNEHFVSSIAAAKTAID